MRPGGVAMYDVSDANFSGEVLQAREPVLVYFGPMQSLGMYSYLFELSLQDAYRPPNLKMCYCTLDRYCKQTVRRARISSPPALIIYKHGRQVVRLMRHFQRANDRELLKLWLDQALARVARR